MITNVHADNEEMSDDGTAASVVMLVNIGPLLRFW